MQINFVKGLFVLALCCVMYGLWGIIFKRSFKQTLRGFSIYLGVMLLLSGIAKFAYMVGHFDFPTVIGPPWIEEKLAPHGLALVGRLLAYSQVIAGALLLSRFATLGAIIAFPIFLSITTVTISQHWGIAPINKIFLLMNALVLAGDWHRLKFLIMNDVPHLSTIPFKRISWKQDVFSLFGIGLILLGVVLTEYGVLIFGTCIGLGILLFLASYLFRKK